MVAPRHGFLCAIVFAMACLSAVGADPPLANPAVAPAQPPAAPPTPPREVEPPRATLRTVHRQVSRLPLTRDYRSVPVGDAATVAAHARIDAALVKVADADSTNFIETPLRDVVAQFREWLQVPVVLDHKGLEDAGIDLDAPVTFTGQGTTARAALRRLLGDLDLTWVVRDESLVITTKEKAAGHLESRLYPLPWSYSTQGAIDFQSLIDLIQMTVGGVGAWADAGGNGAIRPLGEGVDAVLVVSQTSELHDEIEGLLRGLHERALGEFGGPHDLPAAKTPTVRVHHVADEAVREDLAAKLVELCNAALPHGTDAQAKVMVVGECLAVQSLTPEFHALAGQLIRSVAGEQVKDVDWSADPGDGVHCECGGVRGGVF